MSLGTISGRHFFWEHLSPPPPPGALLPYYTKKKIGLLENGTWTPLPPPNKLSHHIVHPLTWPNANRRRKLMSFSSIRGWNPFIYVQCSVELIVARKGGGGEACGYGVVPACPVPLAMASATAAPPPPPLRSLSSSSSICSHSGAVPFVSLYSWCSCRSGRTPYCRRLAWSASRSMGQAFRKFFDSIFGNREMRVSVSLSLSLFLLCVLLFWFSFRAGVPAGCILCRGPLLVLLVFALAAVRMDLTLLASS